ncbi:MAG: Spy/CpxP family protein refolding chaperone [Rubrivivax sp.]|jgi:Spy/CpxP family protein refolding chaperone|nr:Spy/CpxP family protein refolding chaperone [Rubrivivax sp.]
MKLSSTALSPWVWARRPLRAAILTTAVAAASALALPAWSQPRGDGAAGPGMHGRHGGGHEGHRGEMGKGMGMGMGMSERMLDAVKATPEQKAQIRQIMDSARKDMQAQREAGRALHDEGMKIFTAPNVDANAAEALRQKRMAQHDQASRRMMQAMLDASRVLTPDQRRQLAEQRQKRHQMMERHRHERHQLEGGKS